MNIFFKGNQTVNCKTSWIGIESSSELQVDECEVSYIKSLEMTAFWQYASFIYQ